MNNSEKLEVMTIGLENDADDEEYVIDYEGVIAIDQDYNVCVIEGDSQLFPNELYGYLNCISTDLPLGVYKVKFDTNYHKYTDRYTGATDIDVMIYVEVIEILWQPTI